MAKGSPTITFRLDAFLLEDMEIAIADRNQRSREQPWTTTDFIRAAIREKISHMIRSRRSRKQKKASGT